MFKRTCSMCGAEFEISLLKCLAVSLAGFGIGWAIGLPDDTLGRFLTSNPCVAMLLMNRTTSAIFLAIAGPVMVFNSKVCPKCSAVKST